MLNATARISPDTRAPSPLSGLAQRVRGLAEILQRPQRPAGYQACTGYRSSVDDALSEAVNDLVGDTIERLLNDVDAAERTIVRQRDRIAYLERLATTDELTGIYNRRGFEMELKRVLGRAHRYGEEGVLVYVDLDGFKPVNDTYGHQAGDEVLRDVARQLVESVRETDIVARVGGDEFAVLMVQTDPQNGRARADALDRQINNTVVSWNGRMIAVRASLGTQSFGPNMTGSDLLQRADAAMYRIKRTKDDSTIQVMP